MYFPIVDVLTKDGYKLHGFISEPIEHKDTIVIHMHGSGGDFYQSNFYPALFQLTSSLNYSFLSTNSRGTGVYDVETGTKFRGAAVEIFEECLLDIDAWIEFVFSRGYKNVILEGHSFGTNKIQYYALNGKYKDKVKALILLGFTDSFGGQLAYLESVGIRNEDILSEAESLINQGKPYQLLSDPIINWGELPQSAISYKNFMSPNSELSKILCFWKDNREDNFSKINIPILGIVGDRNECTVIPSQEAVNKLNRNNNNAKCYMIKDSNHNYVGKEGELATIVEGFLKLLQT